MAGKLCKENIPVERLVGRGSAQATAETSVMLSGGDRNVALVSCRALPALGAVEVQTGGVAAQGTVEFSALYLTQEGALFSREAQANFSAVMQVEEAAPRMRARVRATIERVEAEEKDGRLDFAAEIRLEGVVVEAAAEALGTGIESETPMAERRARLWARVRAAQGETRLAVSETFPLADPAFARVVYAEAHAQTDPAKVRDGAAEVSGAVTVDCLLPARRARRPSAGSARRSPSPRRSRRRASARAGRRRPARACAACAARWSSRATRRSRRAGCA